MPLFVTRRALLVVFVVTTAGCNRTPTELAQCRYEAEKTYTAAHACEAAGTGMDCPDQTRCRLVRACMEARGYNIDSSEELRLMSDKKYLSSPSLLAVYEPTVWKKDVSRSPSKGTATEH